MSEVLGFRPKKRRFQAITTNNEKAWAVFESELVPVVTKEKYEGLVHELADARVSCAEAVKLVKYWRKKAKKRGVVVGE